MLITEHRYGYILSILAIAVLLLIVLSLSLGRYDISPLKVVKILLEPLTGTQADIQEIDRKIIWVIRLPRILLAFLAGATLSLSGAALQGVFRNPLVDPHIIGVSSGAAFGGTLAILFGLPSFALFGSTFLFGLLALAGVFSITSVFNQRSILTLMLAGVILSGFFSALISLIQYVADVEEQLSSIIFWLLGSFATASWPKVILLCIPCLSASLLLLLLRWRLNILSMGDTNALTLGINLHATRWLILSLCALLVSAQVAVSGSIGWVGLIIPHLARLIMGADHRRLLPAAFLLGGGYMVCVDDSARIISAAEVPVGIITALLGTPVFTAILFKSQRQRIA